MWPHASILAVLFLTQQPVPAPIEARGLHILWAPSAMAGLSTGAPGFRVLDPLTQNERTFSQA